MKIRTFAPAALLVLALAGCGDDDGGDTSQPPPPPSPPPATETFFQDVGSSGAQQSQTGALLDSPDVAELIRTAQANQSIANELTGLSSSYDVTPADVAGIETTACESGIDAAMASIAFEIPGADLSALPALNRLVTEVALDCGAGDPAWVDAFSAAVFRFLMGNTTVFPQATAAEPTPLMRTIYNAGCQAIKVGVVQAIKRVFDHKGPAYGLSLAIGSAMAQCPAQLQDSALGAELQSLIEG